MSVIADYTLNISIKKRYIWYELIKLICIKKAAFRKSEMLLDSYIHGNGTYDFLSCKCHHQLFAFLVIILLQIKE